MNEAPFFVPAATSPCRRVSILEALSDQGARLPSVMAFARDIPGNPPMDIARAALAAVQRVPYVPGPIGEEWMQGASYTLVHGGECKALSVLLCAVLRARGVPCEIVWITQTGKPINHVTVVVTNGNNQYWADPSVKGARLGESPYDAVRRTESWHVVGE